MESSFVFLSYCCYLARWNFVLLPVSYLQIYMIFYVWKCRNVNGLWRNRWRWWFPGGVCLPVLCRIVWYHRVVLSHRWWTYFRVEERGIALYWSLLSNQLGIKNYIANVYIGFFRYALFVLLKWELIS